ncbi:MAG TPA: MFS transporter [Acidimicrobiales bacterium]|nr:MFS transporter [Acidimicrobiales bacterium]
MALASLRPLRSRNFALIWSAALVSNVGTWMQTVALGVLVYARTGQPAWTGLVAAAAFIPIGLLAPLGGALADRLDRRRWLIVTTLAEMTFAALLAVLAATGHDPPTVLVILAFLGGASGAVGFPAYQAMVPDLVPTEDLLGAVSLSSAQFNLGRVVGPALAGLALLTHDYGLVFGLNAASFGAVVVALTLIRLPKPVGRGVDDGMAARIAAGVRAARAEPGCRAAIGLIAFVALLASPFIALVPSMSGVLHHRGGISVAAGTAILVTAQGVGAVTGALALPSLAERLGRRTMLQTAMFVLPVLLALYAIAPTLWWSVVAFLAVGAGYIAVLAGLNTVVQLRAPVGVRGRILSIYMMSLGIVYPIGAVLQGAIANHVGVRSVTIGGAVVLLVGMVGIAAFRPAIFTALGDLPTARTEVAVLPTEELP